MIYLKIIDMRRPKGLEKNTMKIKTYIITNFITWTSIEILDERS